mmetsp:Transcript_36571/g.94429  ORF Transcript_36571/g.94429 Transcript_36571/m.94429 type:complete len:352 (-) Transcript_36571:76-1131(-)
MPVRVIVAKRLAMPMPCLLWFSANMPSMMPVRVIVASRPVRASCPGALRRGDHRGDAFLAILLRLAPLAQRRRDRVAVLRRQPHVCQWQAKTSCPAVLNLMCLCRARRHRLLSLRSLQDRRQLLHADLLLLFQVLRKPLHSVGVRLLWDRARARRMRCPAGDGREEALCLERLQHSYLRSGIWRHRLIAQRHLHQLGRFEVLRVLLLPHAGLVGSLLPRWCTLPRQRHRLRQLHRKLLQTVVGVGGDLRGHCVHLVLGLYVPDAGLPVHQRGLQHRRRLVQVLRHDVQVTHHSLRGRERHSLLQGLRLPVELTTPGRIEFQQLLHIYRHCIRAGHGLSSFGHTPGREEHPA